MTESQQLLMAALSIMITVLVGVLINNSRLSDLRANMDQRFNSVDRRFDIMQAEMNRRFDDSRDIWRSELHRVEEVLDARLKHMEEH
jgi:uncharacterized membrane-anchored protein YhcB (DUF1043 family)